MYQVHLQFANATQSITFVNRQAASAYAHDLLEMFDGEEMWFDNERNCYTITVPQTEIVK